MPTRKVDVSEVRFGIRVEDPYRWLEDSESPEVAAWTREQNERTQAFLAGCKERAPLRARVKALLQTGYVTTPAARRAPSGWRYFWTERRGDAVQPTLVVRSGERDRALIDVSALSEDGTDALDWWYPSQSGALLAWGRSGSGSEKSSLYVRDVETGSDLADVIPDTRHASVAWVAPDRFFYTRYPPNKDYDMRVYEHVLGRAWREDPLVFPLGEARPPEEIPSVVCSPSGRYVVVRVHQGWDRSELHALDRASGAWTVVARGEAALFEPIPTDDHLYVMTNAGAPRWMLARARWSALDRAGWETVLPERSDVLTQALPQRDRVLAAYLREAASVVEIHRFSPSDRGGEVTTLDLGVVSAELGGEVDADEAFVTTTSFASPTTVRRVDREGALSPFTSVGADLADVVTERRYAISKDGTRVPYFVVRRADAPLPAPAIVSGYGGFNVKQTPSYSVRVLAAVERGLVFVSTVLRGGGELGEAWHEAGMLERKQNVFDDFIACAEDLERSGVASKGRLAAIGGSNGGLLVAAVCVQRPDLFRVGVSLVPLTDMLRYHLFRIGRLWIPEYGDPDDEAHARFLYAYSPYHHVERGVTYPSMLFATADADSRVDPMHARKMAARMQEVAVKRPVLLRVEEKAGHGQGKPASKVGEEVADELAFIIEELR